MTDTSQGNAANMRSIVREGYARIAQGESNCCGPSACGCNSADNAEQVALAVGYAGEDLAKLPEGANMGLSCGNPVALASLVAGEVVLDLGSGGGFDAFLAGPRVGATGRVIGVDMTAEMIERARANNAHYQRQTGLDNVEFRLGEIEHLPVADGCVDIVISNCVLNLSPNKPQVWREIARVLKPGGRVAVSDIALLRPLPASVREQAAAIVGCVAGAVLVDESKAMIKAAGLEIVALETDSRYVESMMAWKDPIYQDVQAALPAGLSLADHIASLSISAQKPL